MVWSSDSLKTKILACLRPFCVAPKRRGFCAAVAIESLEQRLLLTTVDSLTDGKLLITSDAASDTVRVTTQNGLLNVDDGQQVRQYDRAAVTSLRFLGNAGNDTFYNYTSLALDADGGAGNDRIIGGTGNDKLVGGDGNDLLLGRDGDDILIGGAGNDRLVGGAGNDTLSSASGINQLLGEDGNDTLTGGSGNDSLYGGAGDDSLSAGSGVARMWGNDGNDALYGGANNDLLFGDAGNDYLFGGDGNDRLFGGDGDDALTDSSGNNRLLGEEGDDILQGGSGNDLLSGGDGNDELRAGTGNNLLRGDGGADRLSGGDGNVVMFGGDGNDFLGAGRGNTRMYGGEGFDFLVGGPGDDLIVLGGVGGIGWGYGGNDRLYGGSENSSLSGDEGDDLLVAGSGAATLDGGTGNDRLFGGSGNDQLFGRDGNDFLKGNGGDDRLAGGAGDDQLFGGGGNDILDGGYAPNARLSASEDADFYTNGAGNDRLFGEAGNDLLTGGAGNDQLFGGDGNDTLDGGAANDLLSGDAGNDILYGRAGHDQLIGGLGSDTLDGGEGNNLLFGYTPGSKLWGQGTDTFIGGAGNDAVISNDSGDTFELGDGLNLIFLDNAKSHVFYASGGITPGGETLFENRLYIDIDSTAQYVRLLDGNAVELVSRAGLMRLTASGGWTVKDGTVVGAGEVRDVTAGRPATLLSGNGYLLGSATPPANSGTTEAPTGGTFAGWRTHGTVADTPGAVPGRSIDSLFDATRALGINLPAIPELITYATKTGAELASAYPALPLAARKTYNVLQVTSVLTLEIGPVTLSTAGNGLTLLVQQDDDTVFVQFETDNGFQVAAGASGTGRIDFIPTARPANWNGNFQGHLFAAVAGLGVSGIGLHLSGSITLDLDRNEDGTLAYDGDLWAGILGGNLSDVDFDDIAVGLNGGLSFDQAFDQTLAIDGFPLNFSIPLGEGTAVFDAGTLYVRATLVDPFADTGLGAVSFLFYDSGYIDGTVSGLTGGDFAIDLQGRMQSGFQTSDFHLTNAALTLHNRVDVLGNGVDVNAGLVFATQTFWVSADFTLRSPISIGVLGRPSLGLELSGQGSIGNASFAASASAEAFGQSLGSVSVEVNNIDDAVLALLDNLNMTDIFVTWARDVGMTIVQGAYYIESFGNEAFDYGWAAATGLNTGRFVTGFSAGAFYVTRAPESITNVGAWLAGGAERNLRSGLRFAEDAGNIGWGTTVAFAQDMAEAITSGWDGAEEFFDHVGDAFDGIGGTFDDLGDDIEDFFDSWF